MGVFFTDAQTRALFYFGASTVMVTLLKSVVDFPFRLDYGVQVLVKVFVTGYLLILIHIL